MMEKFRGTGVAIITPFHQDRSLDLDALKRVVHHCIDGGCDYLVVLGTTGEAATLDQTEKALVSQTVIETTQGRLPLVIGVGGNNTAQLVRDLGEFPLEGFDAVLSVSPYYNKPTQEGIYRHFEVISENSPLPVIMYNVPSRTGSNMLPGTVVRLANNCPNIIGIKEASGDMGQIEELLASVDPGFKVISGDDFTALPTVLAGGAGVISVIAQGVPAEFSEMIRLALSDGAAEARRLHDRLLKGMDLIFEEGNPAGIKAMLEYLNLSGAQVRLPLVEASVNLKNRIGAFMDTISKMPA